MLLIYFAMPTNDSVCGCLKISKQRSVACFHLSGLKRLKLVPVMNYLTGSLGVMIHAFSKCHGNQNIILNTHYKKYYLHKENVMQRLRWTKKTQVY